MKIMKNAAFHKNNIKGITKPFPVNFQHVADLIIDQNPSRIRKFQGVSPVILRDIKNRHQSAQCR